MVIEAVFLKVLLIFISQKNLLKLVGPASKHWSVEVRCKTISPLLNSSWLTLEFLVLKDSSYACFFLVIHSEPRVDKESDVLVIEALSLEVCFNLHPVETIAGLGIWITVYK